MENFIISIPKMMTITIASTYDEDLKQIQQMLPAFGLSTVQTESNPQCI